MLVKDGELPWYKSVKKMTFNKSKFRINDVHTFGKIWAKKHTFDLINKRPCHLAFMPTCGQWSWHFSCLWHVSALKYLTTTLDVGLGKKHLTLHHAWNHLALIAACINYRNHYTFLFLAWDIRSGYMLQHGLLLMPYVTSKRVKETTIYQILWRLCWGVKKPIGCLVYLPTDLR